jgi:hypothetical protein
MPALNDKNVDKPLITPSRTEAKLSTPLHCYITSNIETVE